MDKPIYLFVTPFFPSPTVWRGAYCLDFVKALMRLNRFRVVVLKEGSGEDYVIDGVRVHTFRARRFPSNIFPNFFVRHNQKSFMKKVEAILVSTFNLQPSTCFGKVEICHGNTVNYGIYPLAIKRKNPMSKTLLHHHSLQSFGLNLGVLRHCWLYNMFLFPRLRRIHEQIDCHVFISEASRRSFLTAPNTSWTNYENYKQQMRGLPYRPAQIKGSIILHNGVDKSVFHRKETVVGVSAQPFTIGCVGNFVDWKDQFTLLRALVLLRAKGHKINVRFVGSGPMLKQCLDFVRENELLESVTFEVEMRHQELVGFYNSIDLFVLPSYCEGFGCVFTEAHCCGVPFITCEGQGVDDIIPHEDRAKWLCKPHDHHDLAQKIGNFIEKSYRQVLNEDQDINFLVKSFVGQITRCSHETN